MIPLWFTWSFNSAVNNRKELWNHGGINRELERIQCFQRNDAIFQCKIDNFFARQRNSQELFISLKYLKFFRSAVKRICESSVANIGIYKSSVLNRITSEFSVLANSYMSPLLLTPVYETRDAVRHVLEWARSQHNTFWYHKTPDQGVIVEMLPLEVSLSRRALPVELFLLRTMAYPEAFGYTVLICHGGPRPLWWLNFCPCYCCLALVEPSWPRAGQYMVEPVQKPTRQWVNAQA